MRNGKWLDRPDIERDFINDAERAETHAKRMQQVLLIPSYFDRFAVRRYDSHAPDLRRKECAIATECRPDAGAGNGATDGTTHKVVTAGEFEAMFREFAGEVADAHAGLHGNGVTVRVDVPDLVQSA